MASKLYEYIINVESDDLEINHRLYELSASFLIGTIDFDSDDLENEVLEACTTIAQMLLCGVKAINCGIDTEFVTEYKSNAKRGDK